MMLRISAAIGFFAAGAFSQVKTQTMVITAVVSQADLKSTTFSPGEQIQIQSQNFPSQLGQGYTIMIGGIALTTNATQIQTAPGVAALVGLITAIPASIQPGTVSIVVSYNGIIAYTGGNSAPFPITVSPYSPVFSLGGQADHADGTKVSTASPAQPGEQLTSYVEGLGTAAMPAFPANLTVGGVNVPITSTAVATSIVPGYFGTLTYTLPTNVPIGLQPFVVTIDGFSSLPVVLPVGNPPYPAVPAITSLNTSGSPASAGIAQNAWIEIHGTNLVPATTVSSGLLWNGAASFAQGALPTGLDGISVTVNGKPAYVYFACSAATDTSCATDQINVLTPLDPTIGNVPVVVTNGTTSNAPYTASMLAVAPSMLLFSAKGYIAATHLNYTLIGPSTLYPGASTPAAPGETIVVYGVGFGLPSAALTEGSSTQTGSLPSLPSCKIGGNPATVGFAGLISPGLYQLNITVPANAPNGDNPISCTYNGATTPAGNLVTISS